MSSALDIGTILHERYEIQGIFGSAEGTAAYLANDLLSQETLLLWESCEIFPLKAKPPAAREYFKLDGRHYLALRLEGQTLSLALAAAGQVQERWAASWLLQICTDLGHWHKRDKDPLVCLHAGDLRLSAWHLSEDARALTPRYEDLSQPQATLTPPDEFHFSAPESQGSLLTTRSDVYALGALLYTLLTGQPAPDPVALAAKEAKLVPPRAHAPDVAAKMQEIELKAMHLDPQRRYATAADMAKDLEHLLGAIELEEQKPKHSLLARLAPYVLGASILLCLFLGVSRLAPEKVAIRIPWLPAWATPTYTPAPTVVPTDTPTPTPTLTPTAIPASEAVVNQIRLDQFPRIIAYASVLNDEQEPIVGLHQAQFRVKQDGTDIAAFQSQSVDAALDPLAIVVAMDISGSMKGEPLEKAKAAASDFVNRLDPGDEVSLVKFDDRIEQVHDFSTDKGAIIQAISSLRTRGDTALYDVIAYSVERLGTRPGRRATIVLTDGRDTASVKQDLAGCITEANGASIPVFVIGLDSSQFTPKVMEKNASDTGGEYLFAPTPDDLGTLYQKIRGQLQNQYRIELTSQHGADGAGHTLAVGIAISEGQEIWGEKSYLAPH